MSTHRLAATLALAGLAGLVPCAALAQMSPGEHNPNSVDQQFVQQAMTANAQEIKTANVERYSPDPSVRLFTRTIDRDHLRAAAKLAAIANHLNISYPKAGIIRYTPTEGQPPQGEPSSGQSGPRVRPDIDQSREYMRVGRVSPEPTSTP